MTKITVVKGDIVQQDTDVVVNTTNEELAWEETTVNGAFHTACGPEYTRMLNNRYKQFGILHKGDVYRTESFDLPSNHVFHIMAPTVLEDGAREHLKNVYKSCFKRMRQMHVDKMDIGKVNSISFPSIGTGAFMWETHEASLIAIEAIKEIWSPEYNDIIDEIRFVTYSDADFGIYEYMLYLQTPFLNKLGVE